LLWSIDRRLELTLIRRTVICNGLFSGELNGLTVKWRAIMTPDQVKAIQDSFLKIKPISEQAAELFYGRLFEIAPAIKPLFRGDMKEQGRMLMAVLAAVVDGLGNLESVLPAARALAKRHVGYGVKAADYGPVGAALLWTLERGLGKQWTPELAAAWGAAYNMLSGFMIAEAYGRADKAA
jgi:hemoglobin-like flavoprotein